MCNEIFSHQTRLGHINGIKERSYNSTVYVFKKIPYAKSPVGNLRFIQPQSIHMWTETLDATKYGPNCIQSLYKNDKRLIPNWNISEDCLHLNIFAPFDLNTNSSRSVMVWVHGGSFTNGQGMMFNGSKLATAGNVVIVTINYRLNVFGFANFGTGTDRNLGLWDQKAAIEWVKNNIEDYGGNSQSITIFGESAGGYSVALQSVFHQNKGLFQRTIVHSGSFSGIESSNQSDLTTTEIGRILNCSSCRANGKSCLKCIQQVPAEQLFWAYGHASFLLSGFSFDHPMPPAIDGDLLTAHPTNMLSDPNSPASQMLNSVEFISGTNDCESGLFYFKLLSQQVQYRFNITQGVPSRVVCELFAPYIAENIFNACDKITKAICNKYSTDQSLQHQTELVMNSYTDFIFASKAVKDLDFHSRGEKGTYQYVFTHKPHWGFIRDRPSWLLGANHADELQFVFGLENWYPKDVFISPEEAALSSEMMTYWTNFAKTG